MTQLVFSDATARRTEEIYLTPDVVEQRVKALNLLQPQLGESILDLGCGPGLLTLDLARLVGDAGSVAGLDVSSTMVDGALQRVKDLTQAKVAVGDALQIPYPDSSFDAAVSMQVFEYVPDVPRALGELNRVLRPRGRALVLDTDWRSTVWHSSDEARMRRVLDCWDTHLSDPHLPAKLPGLAREAAFIVRRVEVVPMLSASWQPVSYAAGIARSICSFARLNGPALGLPAADIEDWWSDQKGLTARGDFFFSVNRYAFLLDSR